MRKPVRRSSLGAEGLMIFRQREATAGRAAAGVPTAWLPGWVAYLAGVLGQAAGKYDSQTERLFEHAWRRQRSLRAMVGWLRFRRELGLAPEARQVKSLQTALDGKQGRLTAQTLELLLEAEALAPAVTGLSDKMLMAQANSSPPVAHVALARGSICQPGLPALPRYRPVRFRRATILRRNWVLSWDVSVSSAMPVR